MNILNFICIEVVVRTLAIALGTVGNPWAVAWVVALAVRSPLAAASLVAGSQLAVAWVAGIPLAVAWVAAWRNLEVEHSPLAAAWRNPVAVRSP